IGGKVLMLALSSADLAGRVAKDVLGCIDDILIIAVSNDDALLLAVARLAQASHEDDIGSRVFLGPPVHSIKGRSVLPFGEAFAKGLFALGRNGSPTNPAKGRGVICECSALIARVVWHGKQSTVAKKTCTVLIEALYSDRFRMHSS